VLRSIRDDIVGSWKVLHQLTTVCGSVLTELDAVDVADHAAGTCGSGRAKLGPTEHPSGVTASAMSSSLFGEIIRTSSDAVAEHPRGGTQCDRRDQGQRQQIVGQQRQPYPFEVDTPCDINGI
jgi:hypothetical protein